ncbi:electron transfer flavoprotein beta-subunit [Purpureocillium lilacinum]|uniref:Probable electron transfer flavoprotein subunit beta n=1 Tax=Purpureocillium lilacinum TaxID=33203 RepID=A0A179HZ04_PURLI|nr:electron transfer flavoprotein beta-subunit [Purpureocillium lilacinum]OAQ94659.1 electron transfer flavoprotein beta-subunit [Purpureocillium lilacinum]
MNPFDELSVEESVRIREKKRAPGGVEDICAISAGPTKAQDILRTAMAMGADRGIHVEVKEGDDLEPLTVAKMLKAAAEQQKSNLVILGKQSIDDDSAQTGQMLAGLLGWSQATQASKVEFGEGDSVTVTKEVDGGVETVRAKLPLVVTTDLRLNEPRYASLPNIMKAKKKKLDKLTLKDFGLENEKRLKVLKVTGMSRRRDRAVARSRTWTAWSASSRSWALCRRTRADEVEPHRCTLTAHDSTIQRSKYHMLAGPMMESQGCPMAQCDIHPPRHELHPRGCHQRFTPELDPGSTKYTPHVRLYDSACGGSRDDLACPIVSGGYSKFPRQHSVGQGCRQPPDMKSAA